MKHQRVNERWTRRKDHDRTGYSQTNNIFLLNRDDKNNKKAKGTKKCVIKIILEFNDYNCLFKNEIMLKLQEKCKSKAHCLDTEQVYKIALSSNDDKRLQTFDRIIIYQYGIYAFKVCNSEMLTKYK